MARDTLYYIMKEWYFWYDLMPEVTKENYSDPYKLLDAMRYKSSTAGALLPIMMNLWLRCREHLWDMASG